MSNYYEYLQSKNLKVTYIKYNEKLSISKKDDVSIYDPVDFEILNSFKKSYKNLLIINSPLFLLTQNDIDEYSKEKNTFVHHHFYKWIRIKKKILVDENDKPIGGKWSFDTENRNSFDKKYKESPQKVFNNNKKIDEAQEYIQKHFPKNPGFVGNIGIYAIDFKSAKKALQKFIKFNFPRRSG